MARSFAGAMMTGKLEDSIILTENETGSDQDRLENLWAAVDLLVRQAQAATAGLDHCRIVISWKITPKEKSCA